MNGSADRQDEMHNRVEWLRPSDYPIVDEISDYGGWMKPATLSLNLPYSRDHISRRCLELSKHGLLERYDDNTAAYRITDRGQDYLAGDLDADDLRPDDE